MLAALAACLPLVHEASAEAVAAGGGAAGDAAVDAARLPAEGQDAACGAAETPCKVAEGTYRIVLPKERAGPIPAVMFLHGYGSSSAGAVRNGAASSVVARGYAFIAPQARPGRNGRRAWNFHPSGRARGRDEAAFLQAVLADAERRFGIDRKKTLLAGFSIGGSMVSYVACEHPADFVAYAPVAGSFWRPAPSACSGPVRLLHTHGWRDRTVPLEGRVLGRRDGRLFAQGDVFQAMSVWRAANGCDNYRADAFETGPRFWRRRWTACRAGTALELALHPGGHTIPQGWASMALDWFEALP